MEEGKCMFFTKVGVVFAWLLFVPNLVCFAVVTISVWTGQLEQLIEMFGSRFSASSVTFLKGMAIGVAFGIAAEISRSIAGRDV